VRRRHSSAPAGGPHSAPGSRQRQPDREDSQKRFRRTVEETGRHGPHQSRPPDRNGDRRPARMRTLGTEKFRKAGALTVARMAPASFPRSDSGKRCAAVESPPATGSVGPGSGSRCRTQPLWRQRANVSRRSREPTVVGRAGRTRKVDGMEHAAISPPGGVRWRFNSESAGVN
jgi:hypothetical protein